MLLTMFQNLVQLKILFLVYFYSDLLHPEDYEIVKDTLADKCEVIVIIILRTIVWYQRMEEHCGWSGNLYPES